MGLGNPHAYKVKSTTMKIAIIFHRFGPYHVARIRGLARYAETHAIELSASTSEYDWEAVEWAEHIPRYTLFRETDSREATNRGLQERIYGTLDEIGPEAVLINGWSDRAALWAIRWCRERGVPAIAMSESTQHDHRRVGWKEWFKKRIVGLFSGGFVGGRLHQAYLEDFGLPAGRIAQGYDVIDNDYFTAGAERAHADEAALRAQYGLPENYFLASNRFIPKKNLFRLIDAFDTYAAAVESPFHLVLLGDGPLRAELEARIEQSPNKELIHLPGFRQIGDLPAYYGLARAFVHASTSEQWGLVVNEALAAGLPVLVSERCGCAPELVRPGENGYTFDPHQPEQLAAYMKELTEDADKRARFARRSTEIIRNFTPDTFGRNAAGLAQSLTEAEQPSGITLLDRLVLAAVMQLYN